MNVVSLALGLLLVGFGFVTLIHKVHDRTVHESLAMLKYSRGNRVHMAAPFVGVMTPIVSSIAFGIALLAVAMLTRGSTF